MTWQRKVLTDPVGMIVWLVRNVEKHLDADHVRPPPAGRSSPKASANGGRGEPGSPELTGDRGL
ncbi:hypothetical protein ABZ612_36995 [Streptomyces avermitilis]|uniref:hypothetical protein n=1 Tax=Streptomyces avermitilis TaxID=33903 RepID=UPI0033C9C26B